VSVIKNKKRFILGVLLLIAAIIVIAIFLHKSLKTEFDLTVEKDSLQLSNRLNAKPDFSQKFEDHFLIAQNDKYKMYFEEAGLSIILMDKKTGGVLRS
jgi:predicted small secreted protein